MNHDLHKRELLTISGFFSEQKQVDAVLSLCLQRGIPRDLIGLALSEEAARRFGNLKAGRNTDNWFAWTGRGALIGLLTSALLTLGIILIHGYEVSKQLAFIQLLGPDIGVVLGATLGAVYGWLHEDETNLWMKRAADRDDAMLLLVYLQPGDEAARISEIFSRYGGQNILAEPMLS